MRYRGILLFQPTQDIFKRNHRLMTPTRDNPEVVQVLEQLFVLLDWEDDGFTLAVLDNVFGS